MFGIHEVKSLFLLGACCPLLRDKNLVPVSSSSPPLNLEESRFGQHFRQHVRVVFIVDGIVVPFCCSRTEASFRFGRSQPAMCRIGMATAGLVPMLPARF